MKNATAWTKWLTEIYLKTGPSKMRWRKVTEQIVLVTGWRRQTLISKERICTTTMKTRKGLSICESLPRLDLVTSRAVSYKSADTTIPGRALQSIASCFKTCDNTLADPQKHWILNWARRRLGWFPCVKGSYFRLVFKKSPERWDRCRDPRTDTRGRRRPTSHCNVPGMLYTQKI